MSPSNITWYWKQHEKVESEISLNTKIKTQKRHPAPRPSGQLRGVPSEFFAENTQWDIRVLCTLSWKAEHHRDADHAFAIGIRDRRQWRQVRHHCNCPDSRDFYSLDNPWIILRHLSNQINWIKDQPGNALLSTNLSLQFQNFVSCGKNRPSHGTKFGKCKGEIVDKRMILFDPWSMDQDDLVW